MGGPFFKSEMGGLLRAWHQACKTLLNHYIRGESRMLSIKGKTGLIFLVFFIIYGTLSYGIQRATIYPSFQSLEYEEARKNLFRASEAIYNEIDRIESLCRDWATWDDTCDFLENKTNEHLQTHLQPKTFIINKLNFILFCDTAGNVVWGDCYDLATEERMESLDSLKTQIKAASSLLSYNPDALSFSAGGVLIAKPFPILVSSHPILKNNSEGSILGYLIMGRFLNQDLIEEFKEQAEFDFDIVPIQGETVPTKFKKIAEQITVEKPHLIQSEEDSFLHAYTTAPDINGQKALLVSSKIPRKVIQAGARAMGYAMISMLIAGVFIFIGLRLILQRVILSPVSNLTKHMILVGKTGDLSSRPSLDRRDEIGVLGKEFERMLGKLKEKDDELVKANSKLEEDVNERQRLIDELEKALSEVKTLSGLLPICSSCKRIRDDKGYWNQIESYIHKHSEAEFSHSICPDCVKKLYPDMYDEMYPGEGHKKTDG